MLSIFLLIPLSLMLFVVAIWAVRYAVRSNQFEDLDNASQRIILEDRQERRQTIQAHTAAPKKTDKSNVEALEKSEGDTVINNDIDTNADTSNPKS